MSAFLEQAKREGRWVPGAVAELHAEGWTQAVGVVPCASCHRGTTSVDPEGVPRHLRCYPPLVALARERIEAGREPPSGAPTSEAQAK